MASKGVLPDQDSIHQKVFYSSTIKLEKVRTEVVFFFFLVSLTPEKHPNATAL